MKEKLTERVQLMDEAINKQTNVLHQANADLNALKGARQELLHIIHMIQQTEIENPVTLDNA